MTETWDFASGRSHGDFAALANAGELATEPMREHDRRRHQFRRFVAGVAEHQALVAGALLGVLLPSASRAFTPCAMSGLWRGDDVTNDTLSAWNTSSSFT